MSSRLRLLALVLVSAAWVATAYEPLVRAGFTGGDLERLARAGGWHLPSLPSEPERRGRQSELSEPARAPVEFDGRELLRVAGPEGSFLAGYSLATSHWLWGSGVGRVDPALPYRAENLALLLAAAAGLGQCVRRLLMPWTGSEQARLGGWAAGLVFAVHPACVASVASLEGRADLLALAFSTWSAAHFLRARQERLAGPMLASIALAVFAAFSGELAFGLPFALALAEGLSAHRYRPKHRRLRTALNTFAVFFGVTVLNGVAIASVTGHSYLPEVALGLVRLYETGGVLDALTWLPEKIGLVLLPANPRVLGVLGFVLSGVLLLAALQPALFAARSAPRLWGGVLLWWVLAFAFALLFGVDRNVDPARLAGARELLPAAFVAAGGLGSAATAMGGVRRWLLPAGLTFGLAVLANANAQPWAEASRALEELRADVRAAREEHGRDAALLLLDPPRDVGGIDPLGPGLPWLLHPVFAGVEGESEPLYVRELSQAAFLSLLRQPEARALFAEPTVVLYPRAAVLGADGWATGRGRGAVRLLGPVSGAGPTGWMGSVRSPELDVDPLEWGALRAVLPPSAVGFEPALVRWSASEPLAEGAAPGVWSSAAGRRVGWFDLSSSLAWRLGRRVTGLEFSGELLELERADLERAELVRDLPGFAELAEPRADGADWHFEGVAAPIGLPPGETSWRLHLLCPKDWRFGQVAVQVEPNGVLIARGAQTLAQELSERGAKPLVLELELLVGDLVVQRGTLRR